MDDEKNFEVKKYDFVIIKVGTNTIIKNSGVNKEFLTQLVLEVGELTKQGKKVVIVSSGAVGLGRKAINFTPIDVKGQQGLAAIGQVLLVEEYRKRFSNIGLEVAQVLLSQSDLLTAECFNNIRNAFDFLFEHKVIPIVNENDVVATEELRKNGSFSDNDALASMLATKLKANLLVMLTEKGGLIGKSGEVLEEFVCIEDLATLVDSKGGRGGIDSKLKAILATTQGGCDVFISGSNGLKGFSEGKAIGTITKSKS